HRTSQPSPVAPLQLYSMPLPHGSGPLTSKLMLPVWLSGCFATTVVKPGETPAGTRKVALLPVAVTTWADTPPTVTFTLGPPNPMPVIVTCSPTPAHEGLMLSMRAA